MDWSQKDISLLPLWSSSCHWRRIRFQLVYKKGDRGHYWAWSEFSRRFKQRWRADTRETISTVTPILFKPITMELSSAYLILESSILSDKSQQKIKTPRPRSRTTGIRTLNMLSINFVLPTPTLLVRDRLRGRKSMGHVCPNRVNPGCRHRRIAFARHFYWHGLLAQSRRPALPPS